MAHFTVLVVGSQFGWEEVDELLFPYWFYPQMIDEEEMRADPRFVFDVVNLEEEFERHKLRNPNHKEEYDKYKNVEDWAKEHSFLCYKNDHGWGYWCNPQGKGGKWDWYLIGGRWTGFFILKQKTEGLVGISGIFTESPTDLRAADQARKCDIDWEAMSRRARERGERCWEKAIKAPEYERFNSYDVYPNDTKRSYVERQEKDAFLTCAVIINGEWYEKNYSRDAIEEEINNQKWRPEFIKLLDKISNDAVLTLVDCHI